MIIIRMEEQQYYNEATRDIADLAKNVRATSTFDEMRPLVANFTPGDFDVICARGKKAITHAGNRRFRLDVSMHLEKYSEATTKLDKSLIVSLIVDTVRQKSPDGGFVKFENDCWHEVGAHIAREKVGQSFRDLLHTQYKSSTKAKKLRRLQEQAKLVSKVENYMKTAGSVSKKIEDISSQTKQEGKTTSRGAMHARSNQFHDLIFSDTFAFFCIRSPGFSHERAVQPSQYGTTSAYKGGGRKRRGTNNRNRAYSIRRCHDSDRSTAIAVCSIDGPSLCRSPPLSRRSNPRSIYLRISN